MDASGTVVTNDEIWKDMGVAGVPRLENIRFHVMRLRRQLASVGVVIVTWSGRGYSIDLSAPEAEGGGKI